MSILKTIAAKPWERRGVIGGLDPSGAFDATPHRVALCFFLGTAAILFSLFMVSYSMRMALPDWQSPPVPRLLWLNTALLAASGALLQWAAFAARREERRRGAVAAFAGGGALALLFVVGQLLAWESLAERGHLLAANPANAFYYLLTGAHAAHLLGGLWVWSRTVIRLLSGGEARAARESIALCALYWHFLLAVWLVLFAVLARS